MTVLHMKEPFFPTQSFLPAGRVPGAGCLVDTPKACARDMCVYEHMRTCVRLRWLSCVCMMCMCARAHACVCIGVRAYIRSCARACVCVCFRMGKAILELLCKF